MARDVYIAIMVAAAKGRGVRLTADECFALALDDAIATRAHNGLDESDWANPLASVGWESIDPNKERKGANLSCRAPEDGSV